MSKSVEDLLKDFNGLQTGANPKAHSCFCVGPRNGEPLCPCAMRTVTVENGRYVQKRDLGPVPKGEGTVGNPQDLSKLFGGAP